MCSPLFTGLNEALIGERLTLAEEDCRHITATRRTRTRWFTNLIRRWRHR
jgi:hypothetical protein